jgi:DNA (cytosine-5)-methyltransferase 1
MHTFTYEEFFAGGGMARLGFGLGAECLFANDDDAMKSEWYRRNFPGDHLCRMDVTKLLPSDVPGTADLAWASPPCQDVSAAGRRAGLSGERSRLAFAFLWLMAGLAVEGRAPRVIVIENVGRLVTMGDGNDLASLVDQISALGYRVGMVVIDAKLFVPQSRQRLFIVAVRADVHIPGHLVAGEPQADWHPSGFERVVTRLSAQAQEHWIWWALPLPAPRTSTLADVVHANREGVAWDSIADTERLLQSMSARNQGKIAAAQASGTLAVSTIARRTREGVVRAEVRFNGVSGCLVTPQGGASYPRLIAVDGTSIRSRLLSSREAARLMGLPDEYKLPPTFGDAMRLIGDGVVIPVVAHVTRHLIVPLVSAAEPVRLVA